MNVAIHDTRVCALGEGPLWHPERAQLFWFDILKKQLLTAGSVWQFDEHVSAAGWIDHDRLLIASETALFQFDLTNGISEHVIALEADNPVTRSNDGRADPWGGFWIGTMGKALEPEQGAIYRFFRGELRQLFAPISIPNAICFAPDQSCAYFTDTPTRQIMRQPLDAMGWPSGTASVFVDLTEKALNPDGAVVDQDGCLWVAQWGAGRVIRFDQQGRYQTSIAFPAAQMTCPAFGGNNLRQLYATSAADGQESQPGAGQTFTVTVEATGQREHQVQV